jgi:hypothetical protein
MNNIVIQEYSFEYEDSTFEQILMHERVHKSALDLTEEENEAVSKAYNYLTNTVILIEDGKKVHLERIIGSESELPVRCILGREWELMPYLIEGRLQPRVLEEVKKEFPDAYKVYLKLKEQAKVGGDHKRCQ